MMPVPLRIAARRNDIGEGMSVLRALPTRERRMVGAWCFLDHLGPVEFAPGQGMHVGAHPHIGLQTFTWLIEGEILHRDSLGSEQIIRPGEVNLMSAGCGIVHTEDSVTPGGRLHAAQLWIALPPHAAGSAPAFAHHPELPCWQEGALRLTLLAGSHAGRVAPARVHSPLLGLDLATDAGGELVLPLDPGFEYALLPLCGDVMLAAERFGADEFAWLGTGLTSLRVALGPKSRVLLIGGEPFAEPVRMWWNFVAFSQDEIAAAQDAWERGDARFGQVGDGSATRLVPPPLPWRRKG